MKVRHAVVAFALGTPTSIALAQGDTITLGRGNAFVDGSVYVPHLARVKQSISRNGQEGQSFSFTNDLTLATRDGRPVIRIESRAQPGSPDPTWHLETVMDRRTTELLFREARSARQQVTFAVDAGHVHGQAKIDRDTAAQAIDFQLDVPAFLDAVMDGTLGAIHFRQGLVVRIPTFGAAPAARTPKWREFTVTGRDTVAVGTRRVPAWVVEERGTPRSRIWFIDEPPYVPLWLTYLPDGAIARLEQELMPKP
ncbi:MAG: hypothetical protein ABIY52_01510 [Gemmatimonadaceae bacterium]